LGGIRAAGSSLALGGSGRDADRLTTSNERGGSGVDEAPRPPFFLSSRGGNCREGSRQKEGRKRWRDKSSAGSPTLCGWGYGIFPYGLPSRRLAHPAISLMFSTPRATARRRKPRKSVP
jgi:hypothetical protein